MVASQADLHTPYGGVVPEVAARHHLGAVNAVVDEALAGAGLGLADVGAVAVTRRPGLIGALLVGVATAKALAYAAGLPLVMVDHLHGHIAAVWLEPTALDPPFVSLVASGGHTRLDLVRDLRRPRLLGQTLDDAAGEAFDKGARLLGLGYPGGAALERLAGGGDRDAFRFPVGLAARGPRGAGADFSFAGVKTALLYAVRELGEEGAAERRADLAASYQEAIVRPLAERLVAAARRHRVPAVALGGGRRGERASARAAAESAGAAGLRLAVPAIALCTDNAAMIGAAAQFTDATPWPDYLGLDAVATAPRAASPREPARRGRRPAQEGALSSARRERAPGSARDEEGALRRPPSPWPRRRVRGRRRALVVPRACWPTSGPDQATPTLQALTRRGRVAGLAGGPARPRAAAPGPDRVGHRRARHPAGRVGRARGPGRGRARPPARPRRRSSRCWPGSGPASPSATGCSSTAWPSNCRWGACRPWPPCPT